MVQKWGLDTIFIMKGILVVQSNNTFTRRKFLKLSLAAGGGYALSQILPYPHIFSILNKGMRNEITLNYDCQNDVQIKNLEGIIDKFLQQNNDQTTLLELHNWYLSNTEYISSIKTQPPTATEGYHRNCIIHNPYYDVFIHVMRTEGHTAIHGHGLNPVFILNLDSDIHYTTFKPSQNTSMRGLDFNKLAIQDENNIFEKGTVFEKAEHIDLIHYVFNPSRKLKRFMEIYIKEGHIPIYLPVADSILKDTYLIYYPENYGYALNEALFSQVAIKSSNTVFFKGAGYLQEVFKKELSNPGTFLVLPNDTVITSQDQLVNYCLRYPHSSLFNLYKKDKVYAIELVTV